MATCKPLPEVAINFTVPDGYLLLRRLRMLATELTTLVAVESVEDEFSVVVVGWVAAVEDAFPRIVERLERSILARDASWDVTGVAVVSVTRLREPVMRPLAKSLK